MSDDEMFIGGVCMVVAAIAWFRQYRFSLGHKSLAGNTFPLDIINAAPLVCMAGLTAVLLTLSSFDVRQSPLYIGFYLVIGAAWLAPAGTFFSVLGFSWKDDVVANKNMAATIVFCAVLAGQTATYSGANIGDGPGWWCVFVAGGLALGSWLLLWLIIQLIANVADQITVERDLLCGIRFGTYLVASGIIFGRGAAGDWTSFEATVREFGIVWPVLIPALITAVLELILSKTAISLKKGPLKYAVTAAYIAFIVIFLALFFTWSGPLPKNPIYGR
jgi:hypothetical protein